MPKVILFIDKFLFCLFVAINKKLLPSSLF
jgi:hypothetical protein